MDVGVRGGEAKKIAGEGLKGFKGETHIQV